MANKNKTECGCEGFYEETGSCLPYDPAIHLTEPCPPNKFWSGIGKWLEGTTQEQWVGGTYFGIQMCQLLGGCGKMVAGSWSDPNSPAYLQYLKEERRKTNAMIMIGLLIAAALFYVAYQNKK